MIVDAEDSEVRRVLLRAAPLALAAAVLAGVPGTAGAATDPAADLARVQAELAAVTERAQVLAAALDEAAARDGGWRVELDRLAEQQDRAQAQVDATVRQVYMRSGRDPLADLVGGLAASALRPLAEAELERRASAAAVRAERDLYEAAASTSQAAEALQAQAALFRDRLRAEAAEVLAAQDTARALLAEAERALAEQEAREAERSRQAAARAAAATERARLEASRAALDAVSATVTRALTPAQSRRSRNAAAREAPVLALVEAAGSGYPAGYGPTGQVLRGVASWYGPGFVGNPTASGTPYDPERLTCAHKTLPLGTVVRVTRGSAVISCLVNDRGPYVADRIIDLSRAGSRALGFDGIAPVVVEVLAPTA